ncbi:putative DNA-binding transcriptional regulator YafY [Arthrobacter stackebrandtii]|uniref:DNA-binding transcriptional regulator YafY n=1 Tax=Arthrobacter stackebrandtii TaxID=272161 RepID=A0ABS4YXB1_9MICC|nr:WYL domain-containing protein [Arthrobacter stackebrandtii]MBP2412633.1 putative DNA-binding transcriptional regulator YafY [Arthrobacter stackebrandtii]PYG98794.1 transcriptional regulator [Arthrobacter stackebrandtii]
MKRTERLHALSEMLRRSGSRGRTAERLASEFGVSVRTIKRDLDALENSGAPVWARPGPGGGYGLAGRANLPPITLTPEQAVALLAAVTAAPDAPFADLAAAGIRKIVDVLDPRTRKRADELARRIWINTETPVARVISSALEQAMAEQLVVRIRYSSATGNTTTRDVEPVIFACRDGRWYLIGWCRMRNDMRWFLLKRIERASVTRMPCGDHGVEEAGIPPATARSVRLGDGQQPVQARPDLRLDPDEREG